MSMEGPPASNDPEPSPEVDALNIPQNSEDLEDGELKDLVLRNLRETGISNEDVRKLLVQWASRKERAAVSPRDRVLFEIERARLYLDAEYHDEGVQALEEARMMALGEGLDDLVEEVDHIWDSI